MKTEKTNQKIETGKISDERFAALQNEYKKVLIIKLKVNDNEDSYGYIRKYTIHHLEKAFHISSQEGLVAAGRWLLEQLWIEGDSRMQSIDVDDVEITGSAAFKVGSFIEFLQGEIKNA